MRVLALSAWLVAAAAPVPVVSHAWVRASLPHQSSTAAYFTVTSPTEDTLRAVSSPDAGTAMLHATVTQGGMIGMHDMDALEVPANRPVVLAPRGMHVMLMNLKHPLAVGQTVELLLEFAKAGPITVNAPVRTSPP